jgi:hypothetical protein
MSKRAWLAFFCLAWLSSAAPALAQEQATLVLKSGERISGELVDLGGVGFTMNVSGQERRVPQDDVAVIEFVGGDPSGEVQTKLNAGGQVVVLRNGQVIDGRLFDIGGTRPLRVTIDTASGQRNLTSSEVARVYLAAPRGQEVATGGSGAGGAVTVPANQPWTSTNLSVRSGDTVNFSASGQIRFTPSANDVAQPSGVGGRGGVFGRRAGSGPNDPLPVAPKGALIGRIDEGQPFLVGDQRSLRMPASGTLYLGVNDDVVSDNGGEFRVVVTPRAR